MRDEPKSDQKITVDPKESFTNIKPFDASPLEVIKEAVNDNGWDHKNSITITDEKCKEKLEIN